MASSRYDRGYMSVSVCQKLSNWANDFITQCISSVYHLSRTRCSSSVIFTATAAIVIRLFRNIFTVLKKNALIYIQWQQETRCIKFHIIFSYYCCIFPNLNPYYFDPSVKHKNCNVCVMQGDPMRHDDDGVTELEFTVCYGFCNANMAKNRN